MSKLQGLLRFTDRITEYLTFPRGALINTYRKEFLSWQDILQNRRNSFQTLLFGRIFSNRNSNNPLISYTLCVMRSTRSSEYHRVLSIYNERLN